MHRTSSHIGSLQDYKPKKLWKSIVSKESSSSSISSSSSESALSRTLSRSATNAKKRSSMMLISEPSAIRSNGLKNSSTVSGLSSLEMGTKSKPDLAIDPKERDFRSKLSENRHQSIYLLNQEDDDDDDVGSLHFINMEDTNQEIDTLSSALEDYKIFTKKTTANSTKPSVTKESIKESRLSSLPSFSSTTTIDSQISVLHVSNSLWIGSTINDLDEDENDTLQKQGELSYFKEFDPENLFNYDNDITERTNRTSLVFL